VDVDFRDIDLLVTGAILVAALLGAVLSYRSPAPHTRKASADSHAIGYLIIAATVGPVVFVRTFGPGGLDVISQNMQVMTLAFGHTFALVLVLTVLVNTIQRVRHER